MPTTRSRKSPKKSVTRKSPKKSVTRKAKKSVTRKSPSKKDVYHVTLKLVFQPNKELKKENRPSRSDFLAHLREHFGDDEMYSLIEYNEPSYMLHAKLKADVLTFDIPKHLVEKDHLVYDKKELKLMLQDHSLADSAWEGGKSNFFYMNDTDKRLELATIAYKVSKIE